MGLKDSCLIFVVIVFNGSKFCSYSRWILYSKYGFTPGFPQKCNDYNDFDVLALFAILRIMIVLRLQLVRWICSITLFFSMILTRYL